MSKEDMPNKKELFVFGAGASYASGGMPLGQDLVWRYEVYSGLSRIENGKPAKDDIAQKNAEFINYGRFLQSLDKIFPRLNAYNKWQEQLNDGIMFDLYYQFGKEYYADEIAKIFQEKKDLEGIELLKQLVLEHIGEAMVGARNLSYKEFIKKIAGRSSEDISIISFNFDTLLAEDIENRVYFDYLIAFDMVEGYREWYNRENGISLIKLNGSLDWAICQKCNKIKLLHHFVVKGSYENNYCKMTKDCDGKLKPLIFLPHEEKNGIIKALWDGAVERIKKADKITIIGYSFPHYDSDVTQLFKEYARADAVVEIIDYEEREGRKNAKKAEIQNRTETIFPSKDNVKISVDGFDEYLKRF